MSRRAEEESATILNRVRDLIGKSDRRIAKTLIREGLFALPSKTKADDPSFIDSCRRTVNNYRHKVRDGWKKEKLPKPGDPVSAHEFIAACNTRIDDLDDLIERSDTRATAKVNAYGEIRQLMTQIAKVRGVAVDLRDKRPEEGDGEGQKALPFLGVFADLSDVPAEIRERIQSERRNPQKASRSRSRIAGASNAGKSKKSRKGS